jgi:hypothetical protein
VSGVKIFWLGKAWLPERLAAVLPETERPAALFDALRRSSSPSHGIPYSVKISFKMLDSILRVLYAAKSWL